MRSLLVLSGGHPYEAEPFEDLIHSLGEWDVEHLIHPEAERAVANGAAQGADALLFYDMGGYTFGEGVVESRMPSEGYMAALSQRFASGKGAVAMHHALAGWAEWPLWHQWLGGQFHYQRGAHGPDSGYRHDVAYTAQAIAGHPVTHGLPASFPVTDELYLCPVDEAAVTPLIRADGFDFTDKNFYSAANAVAGDMFSRQRWSHPAGSNLIGWETRAENAPLIYLQFGDGPETYANPHIRRALSNALHFIAGEQP